MSCENCDESAYVIDKLAKLLAEIAVIVNGVEPHDTSWSYHDLPEKVRALKQAPPAALAVPEGFAALVDAADNAYDSAEGVAYVEFYRREPVEKLLAACRAMLAAERAKGECPHAARCDCLGGCKRGMRGNGAVEVKP